MERKLAAIFSADVVGYSRLMGADEDATLEALRSHRDVLDGLIATHRGRVFNSAGDSVVAEFPSAAVEAGLCAVDIQQEIARRNEPIPKDKRLQFRIGINIGDVVVDGGNLFGDGINIADRVQKLAEPNGICVSRNVYDQLRSKVEFKLEPMGEHRVKNIVSPISVYRILVGDTAKPRPITSRLSGLVRRSRRVAVVGTMLFAAVAGLALWQWQRTSPAREGLPSVAVLAFQNFGGDAALDSYSNGVAEDLTTAMSRFPGITVLSRSSSFALAGADPRQDKKVDYIVEGSVQKTGSGLRINAQLIDTHADAHVWAERYDGSEASALQDEAIGRIANALASEGGAIRRYEYKRTAGVAKADFSEYDYFLSGHEIIARFASIEEHDRGGAIWQEGLKQFPDSALLRVSLAWYHFFRPWDFNTEKPWAADYRRAGELARGALAQQNISPGIQWSGRRLTAYIHWFEGDFERAVADTEAAVALAPYDADTLSFMARVQAASGNTARALEWVQDSIRRDPAVQRNTRILAWIYYLNGEYEKSIEAAREHQQLSRQFGGDASSYMVASYVRLGRLQDARAALKRALQAEPQWSQLKERNDHLGRPYKDPAVFERQLADLAVAGLPELPFGYDGRAPEKLSAEEIKALTFGHTLRAKDVRSGASFADVVDGDGTIRTSGDFGEDTGTLQYLGNSLICHRWRDMGPSCATIFRSGSEPSQSDDAFTLVDAWGEYRYSIVK